MALLILPENEDVIQIDLARGLFWAFFRKSLATTRRYFELESILGELESDLGELEFFLMSYKQKSIIAVSKSFELEAKLSLS